MPIRPSAKIGALGHRGIRWRMAALVPVALLLLSMVSFMAGASIAKTLFAVVSPMAVATRRNSAPVAAMG